MAQKGGIPGPAIGLATVGGVLVYAGLRGESPLQAVRSILAAGRTGTAPPGVPAGQFRPFELGPDFANPGGGDWGPADAAGGGFPQLAAQARRYLGRPYRWAGTFQGSGGGDCSGLVYRCFLNLGITDVPRVSTAQIFWGKVHKIGRAQVAAGDLTYWPGAPAHIGIAISNTHGIYAPRTGTVVQIQRIDRPRAGLICGRYTGGADPRPGRGAEV
jgi:hypothetical protein